jgi:dipeptidyl aminopeptidase/acylaminoacyl peptidase
MSIVANPWRTLTRVLIFVVTLALAGVFGWPQTPAKHRVTFADLGTFRQVDNMQLSPDGRALAYVVSDNTTYPHTASQLWIVSTREGSVPKRVAQGTVPTWSPDGTQLAYYSGAPGAFQLWLLDVATGKTEQITSLPGGIDPDPFTRIVGYPHEAQLFSWCPDGTKLVFASQVVAHPAEDQKLKTTSRTKPQNVPETPLVLTTSSAPELAISGVFSHGFGGEVYWASWEKPDSKAETDSPPVHGINQLFIVDVRTKTTRRLTNDELGYFNPDWSPDGKEILASSTAGVSPIVFAAKDSTIYAIDAASGAKRPLVTTSGGDARLPQWSPDGRRVAYLAGGYSGRQALYVVPRQGGKPVQIADKLDRDIYVFHWLPDDTSVLLLMKDGLSEPILSFGADGENSGKVNETEEAARSFLTVSRTGDSAWQQSDDRNNNVIRFRCAQSKISYALVDLNPQVKDWDLGAQRVVRWKNSRGDEIEGTLILPPDYQPGKRYPLILDCYPGMTNSFKASPYGANHVWATRGYIIFNPSARAPHVWIDPFKNKEYDEAAKGPNGWDITFDDIMSGVDELIHQGMVDPDRMGLFGFSNGGGIADYLVTKTSRFRCAVVDAAVYPDWIRPLLLEGDAGVTAFAGGITPWNDPEGYIRLSAVFHLDKVTTPMLLADGDNDRDFLLGMIEMYNGLRFLGKEVTFVRYPGQAHALTGWALNDFEQRTMDFFDAHLKAQPSTL